MCGKKVWEDFAKILRNARDIVISSDVLFRCAETMLIYWSVFIELCELVKHLHQ
jgi:hypothetical protein